MSARNGGSAFPGVGTEDYNSTAGMTLRDWFAGQALAGGMATEDGGTVNSAAQELGIEPSTYDCNVHWPLLVAKRLYRYADAMLAERVKEKS